MAVGFAPQAIRLTKLVAPPYGSSIASSLVPIGVCHVKSGMMEASDLVQLTSWLNHAINRGSVFWESCPKAHTLPPKEVQTGTQSP